MALLYVSTAGSDTNSGASGSPFKSISKAAAMAKPGDTVLVAGGTYTGNVTISSDGAAGAPITFKPVDGQKVILDGAGTANGSHLVTIHGDYITFQGFEVKNAKFMGITTLNNHDVKIIGNKIHDTDRNGIFFQATTDNRESSYNNVAEGNEIWRTNLSNQDRNAAEGWGQAVSTLRSNNVTIKGNYVHDNWGEGIDIIESRGAKVLDNIVHDNFSVQIYLDGGEGATVQNNTVYHTNKTEFFRTFNGVGQPGYGIQIANEAGGVNFVPSKNITVTGNVLGGVGEPKYMNYGAGGGLINSTISPNTVHTTPDPVIAANPNPAPKIPGATPTPPPTPTPTPTPTPPPVEPVPSPTPTPDGVVTKIGAGSDTLTVKITQDYYQGDAQYAVFVDGKQVGGTFTAKALKGSGKFDTLEIKGDWAAGNHAVTVKLLNDAWGTDWTVQDRNLHVEGVTYNGSVVSSTTQTVWRSSDTDPLGSKTFTVADSTAVPSTGTPPLTPTNPTGLTLQGTASADTLKGGSLGDTIHGNGGNDVIYGYGGNDSLSGGEGNDTIYGGDGNDVLTGGNGSDCFVFSSASVTAGGVDRITDFDWAADMIDLGVEFTALTNGTLRADEFRLGERAADWNDRIIYNKATGELFYDADGNGSGAQVKFAQLTPNTSLANLDFFVY